MADWTPNCTFFTDKFPNLLLCTVGVYITSWFDGLLTFPQAWTTKPIKQDVVYEDTQGVKDALDKLQKLPPLVTTQEVCFESSFLIYMYSYV